MALFLESSSQGGENMQQKKRVLVLCGNGVATSTVAARQIDEYLKKEGISAEVFEAKVQDAPLYMDTVNLIVLMAMHASLPEAKVPIVKGLPFITGIGREQLLAQIKQLLSGKS